MYSKWYTLVSRSKFFQHGHTVFPLGLVEYFMEQTQIAAIQVWALARLRFGIFDFTWCDVIRKIILNLTDYGFYFDNLTIWTSEIRISIRFVLIRKIPTSDISTI